MAERLKPNENKILQLRILAKICWENKKNEEKKRSRSRLSDSYQPQTASGQVMGSPGAGEGVSSKIDLFAVPI